MKLIVVEAEFSSEKVSEAIRLFEAQAATVRGMEGCEHYKLFRTPDEPRIAIVQRWTSMEAFDAYRDSPVMATLGQGLKPIMSKPPVTIVAEIED